MSEGTPTAATALVLRDVEGTLYILDEQAIRACRATPEQQEMLTAALAEEEVAGFQFMTAAGKSGPLFFITQAETREHNRGAGGGWTSAVRAGGVFSANIAPAVGSLRF